jgi:Putative MetA-pathway of phenol degradation
MMRCCTPLAFPARAATTLRVHASAQRIHKTEPVVLDDHVFVAGFIEAFTERDGIGHGGVRRPRVYESGFTYNFGNPHTYYQNGVNMHLDVGTSRFVTKELQLGLVGYAYKQISCDTGAGNRLGCFEAQVFGIGPQIGYLIPMGHLQGYLNLKGYREFEAEHRASGWNAWLTFAISPAPPSETPPKAPPTIRK